MNKYLFDGELEAMKHKQFIFWDVGDSNTDTTKTRIQCMYMLEIKRKRKKVLAWTCLATIKVETTKNKTECDQKPHLDKIIYVLS